MAYEFEHQPATPTGEGVAKIADIYVVRGVDAAEHLVPSPELLAAVKRLSPGAQALMQRLIDVGFQAVVRK